MLIIFLVLSLLAILAAASYEGGPLLIQWLDYNIEISITLLVLSTLILLFTLCYLIYFLIYLKNIPSSLKKYYDRKHDHENLTLFINASIAAQCNDLNKLHHYLKKVNYENEQAKLLKPLFLLLNAQYEQAMKNDQALENCYQELFNYDELKIVALKGLIQIRMDKRLYFEALIYAEKATKIQYKTDWLLQDLIEIYIQLHQYDLSEQTIKKATNYKFISKEEAQTLLLNNYIDMSSQYISNSEQGPAIDALKAALNLDPSNYKAISILSRLYIQDNNKKAAHKIIEKAWKNAPSLELARLMLQLYHDTSTDKQIKVIEDLADTAPNAKESYLMMAELCIDADMIPAARAAMDKLLSIYAPDNHMSKLMALIEAKAQNNYSIIINWLKKLS